MDSRTLRFGFRMTLKSEFEDGDEGDGRLEGAKLLARVGFGRCGLVARVAAEQDAIAECHIKGIGREGDFGGMMNEEGRMKKRVTDGDTPSLPVMEFVLIRGIRV